MTATVVLAIAAKEFVGSGVHAMTTLAVIALVGGWLGLVLLAERRIADLIDRGQTQAGRRPVATVGLVLLMCIGGLWVSLLRG